MTNKNLLYNTWNSTQFSVMTYMGTESKKKSGHMCIYINIYIYKKLIHFAVQQKLIQYCKSTILQ